MNETHEHEPYLGLDRLIRCRTCGVILPSMKQQVCKVQSARQAWRVLSRIAVDGKYQAFSYNDDFLVFRREKDGLVEEVSANKLGLREYTIIKKIFSTAGGDY